MKQSLLNFVIALCIFYLCGCFREYEWTTFGGQGTREFKALIDSHPFFDNKTHGDFDSSKFSSLRVDKSLNIDPKSLVAVGNQYLFSSNENEVWVKTTLTGEEVFKTTAALSVLMLNGSAHFSVQPANKFVTITRKDSSSETEANFTMADGFDWSNINFGGDILGYNSSIFVWGNEIDNRSLTVDWTSDTWVPNKDVPIRWPSDRSKFAVWHDQSTFHTIWTMTTASLTFKIIYSTLFPFEIQWSIPTPFYPLFTLYHSRAEAFIFVDQEGVKSIDISNGQLQWEFKATGIKQLAASNRREEGNYLYYINDTDVTFLRFDGLSVIAERTYGNLDQLQAISVLHGNEDNEEIIFLSGTSNAFYGISIEGKELFKASDGDKCLSPVIFKENLTFVCADLEAVKFFRYGDIVPPSSKDWYIIAMIVIGVVLVMVLLIGVGFHLFSAHKKQADPETIY